MGSHQFFLFVPPAYGAGSYDLSQQLCCATHTRDGSNPDCAGNCTSAMIQWAIDVYDWARNDSRIVGLNPWHMNGAPQVNASFEPGLVYVIASPPHHDGNQHFETEIKLSQVHAGAVEYLQENWS